MKKYCLTISLLIISLLAFTSCEVENTVEEECNELQNIKLIATDLDSENTFVESYSFSPNSFTERDYKWYVDGQPITNGGPINSILKFTFEVNGIYEICLLPLLEAGETCTIEKICTTVEVSSIVSENETNEESSIDGGNGTNGADGTEEDGIDGENGTNGADAGNESNSTDEIAIPSTPPTQLTCNDINFAVSSPISNTRAFFRITNIDDALYTWIVNGKELTENERQDLIGANFNFLPHISNFVLGTGNHTISVRVVSPSVCPNGTVITTTVTL